MQRFALGVVEGIADAILVVREGDDLLVSIAEPDGFIELDNGHMAILLDDASLFDEIDEDVGASVGNGRLDVGNLNDEIIDLVGAKGGEDMFDGVNADLFDGDGGATGGITNLAEIGGDERLAREVGSAEGDACILLGG